MSDYVFAVCVASDGRLAPEWSAGAFPAITGYALDAIIRPGAWRRLIAMADQPLVERARAALLRGKTQVVQALAASASEAPDGFIIEHHNIVVSLLQEYSVVRIVGATLRNTQYVPC